MGWDVRSTPCVASKATSNAGNLEKAKAVGDDEDGDGDGDGGRSRNAAITRGVSFAPMGQQPAGPPVFTPRIQLPAGQSNNGCQRAFLSVWLLAPPFNIVSGSSPSRLLRTLPDWSAH